MPKAFFEKIVERAPDGRVMGRSPEFAMPDQPGGGARTPATDNVDQPVLLHIDAAGQAFDACGNAARGLFLDPAVSHKALDVARRHLLGE